MKKVLGVRGLGLFLFLALIPNPQSLIPALHATTITGTVKDSTGAGVTGKIEFELSAPGVVADPALVIQYPKRTCAITAGVIALSCAVRGNDAISNPSGTTYQVRIFSSDGRELARKKACSITTANWNVTAMTGCQ